MGEMKVVEEVEEQGELEWDQAFCEQCPMWEVFPFKVKCEDEKCGEEHDSDRGLCRLKAPVALRGHDGQGIWPTTNFDDWCAEGRGIIMDMQEQVNKSIAEEKAET